MRPSLKEPVQVAGLEEATIFRIFKHAYREVRETHRTSSELAYLTVMDVLSIVLFGKPTAGALGPGCVVTVPERKLWSELVSFKKKAGGNVTFFARPFMRFAGAIFHGWMAGNSLSSEAVSLMVSLSAPSVGEKVFCPFASWGGIAIATARSEDGRVRVTASEPNAVQAISIVFFAKLLGLSNLRVENDWRDMRDIAIKEGMADLIMMCAPMGAFTMAGGLPDSCMTERKPHNRFELEMANMALSCVRDGGRVAVVLPESLVDSAQFAKFRSEIERIADIILIVSMMKHSVEMTGCEMCMVLLRRRKQGDLMMQPVLAVAGKGNARLVKEFAAYRKRHGLW